MGRKKNPYKDIKLNTTQQRVFDYMLEFGSITTLQAYVDLAETRLSARIWELKEKNIIISSEMVEVTNRFGEKRHVKRYWIG